MSHILAIDQGTTSTRAILFDERMRPLRTAQSEFPQHFPKPGWVEHDPADLIRTVRRTCLEAAGDVIPAAIGLTNQRETTLVWNRHTGEPVHNAIVWQDRRTAETCADLKRRGYEEAVTAATGLLLDPYFSATKLAWILEHVEGARAAAKAGDLLFGTVDAWINWTLCGTHVTDATNAARTMLYNIHQGAWDADMCAMLDIPMGMLPEVRDCAGAFGVTDLFGPPVPVLGVAGDQQAATVGQGCFQPGMMKSTYGTGCFALLNTGAAPVRSKSRLLTTIAYQLDGTPTYALEGSIFIAGAVVQWLRDGLRIIDGAHETQALAEASDPDQPIYIVPAFTGLGAPYWDADCRGAVYGLTRNSGREEFARAALESVGYQTRDLLEAMRGDGAAGDIALRVDGGMTASDWTMQFLSDILAAPVDRPVVQETTALGAAWLAGMAADLYPGPEGFADTWALDRRFEPTMPEARRSALYAGWADAVGRTLSR